MSTANINGHDWMSTPDFTAACILLCSWRALISELGFKRTKTELQGDDHDKSSFRIFAGLSDFWIIALARAHAQHGRLFFPSADAARAKRQLGRRRGAGARWNEKSFRDAKQRARPRKNRAQGKCLSFDDRAFL